MKKEIGLRNREKLNDFLCGFFSNDGFGVKLHLKENQASWEVFELEDLEEKRVAELASEGMSQRDIAQETGLSLSKVNRILRKLK